MALREVPHAVWLGPIRRWTSRCTPFSDGTGTGYQTVLGGEGEYWSLVYGSDLQKKKTIKVIEKKFGRKKTEKEKNYNINSYRVYY